LIAMPRGFWPTGMRTTRPASPAAAGAWIGRRSVGVEIHLDQDVGARDHRVPTLLLCSNSIAHGTAKNSWVAAASRLTPRFMLMVCVRRPRCLRCRAEIDHRQQRLDVHVEAHRAVGRSADVGHVGTVALDDDVVELVRERPVANVKVGGLVAATWFSTEPFELKPVLASGWSTTSPITLSFLTEIT
jgi:hypothetical protein